MPMSNATKKYPTRARISLDLFTSIFLSPKTVLATEAATCKYPRGRGREAGQGGEEGHRDGGGRAKDRKRGEERGMEEGREGGKYPFTESCDCWEPLVFSGYNQGL